MLPLNSAKPDITQTCPCNSLQDTVIFHGCKNDNFQKKNCNTFHIFAQNTYNVILFFSKFAKNCIAVAFKMKYVWQRYKDMSLVMRKPVFCICKKKDADQLRSNREADQHVRFRYLDSSIPLLPKSEISSL